MTTASDSASTRCPKHAPGAHAVPHGQPPFEITLGYDLSEIELAVTDGEAGCPWCDSGGG